MKSTTEANIMQPTSCTIENSTLSAEMRLFAYFASVGYVVTLQPVNNRILRVITGS